MLVADGFGPEHRRHNTVENNLTTANVDSLAEAWTVTVEGAASEPITADGRVFTTVTGRHGVEVLAVDAGTGQELWREPLVDTSSRYPEALVSGVPVTLAGRQLRSGWSFYDPASSFCDGDVSVLSPEDGTTHGSSTFPSSISPIVEGDAMLVQTIRWLFNYDGGCSGGALQVTAWRASWIGGWEASVPGAPASPFTLMATPPVVVGGQIFVANGSMLSKLPLAGCGAINCTPTWSVDLGVPIDNAAPVGGESGQVYLAPTGGPLLAVSAENGAELWRVKVASGQTLGVAVADGFLFLSRSRGSSNQPPPVEVYDGATGTRVGSTTNSTQEAVTAPTLAGGVLYRASATRVEAFDAAACTRGTCPVIGSVALPGRPRAVSVAHGQLLVAGNGYIAAFAPD